jgi:Xaa-Pro aminopeptidase
MTTTNPPEPPAFTSKDFAARMSRVVSAAVAKGLAGVIVTPGPDLVWLTGYRPTAITERLTLLVLTPDNQPTLLVPVLERPDAEAAEGAGSVSLVDWKDGTDPYDVAGPLLRPEGEFGSPILLGPCIYSVCNACCRSRATDRLRRVSR